MARRSASRVASDSQDDLAAYFARPDLDLDPKPTLPPGVGHASNATLFNDAIFDLPHKGRKKRASSLSRLFHHAGDNVRHERTGRQSRRSSPPSRSRSHTRREDGDYFADCLPRQSGSPLGDRPEPDSPEKDPAPRGLFSREARRQSRERQQQQCEQEATFSTSSFRRRRADSAPTMPRLSSPTWRDDSAIFPSERQKSIRGALYGLGSEAAGPKAPMQWRSDSAASTRAKKLSQTLATQTGPATFDGASSSPNFFKPTTSVLAAPPGPISAPGPPQQPLFKMTFSPRQLARLQRASKHVERHDRKLANKGMVGAELKVALGLFDVLNKEKKEQKRVRGHVNPPQGEVHGPAGLAGLAHQLEEQVDRRLGSVEHDLRESEHRFEAHVDRASVAKGVGGAAALVGLVGAGYEMWQHEKKRREAEREKADSGPSSSAVRSEDSSVTRETRGHAEADHAGRPSSAASLDGHGFAPLHLPASLSPRAVLPHPTTPYLSSLTPAQHHLVQHAAAALLLKDHARGDLHEKLHRAVGGVEKMVRLLEVGIEKAWNGVSEHAPAGTAPSGEGGGRRPKKLFGTPLPVVTYHEGVDSFHGADPHGTVRIPEFIDHCITALMQADVTVEGILRKNGKLRLVREIMEALDSNGGNDAVIDLAALDPVTLADLFKRFLAALPDPVLTSHLFKLFVACSHIHNVNMRRRCMHLVLCLMPKVNRDVLEVVFLFLEWLSQFAHITVKDGNQMNLTAIATVMAPTLLRPTHRDPKPTEINAMIAAILSLLEDQHFLHTVPLELAQVLHLHTPPQKKDVEGKKKGLEGGAALLHALAKVI